MRHRSSMIIKNDENTAENWHVRSIVANFASFFPIRGKEIEKAADIFIKQAVRQAD